MSNQVITEVFKPINLNGIEHHISNKGNLIVIKNGEHKKRKPYLLNGYNVTTVTNNGKQKRFRIHRLVAEAFVPNPKSKPWINHKNGIKTDNSVENIEWCTASENARHASDTRLNNVWGQNNPNAKLSDWEVNEIKNHHFQNKLSAETLALKYKVHKRTIYKIIKGEIR